MPPIRRKKNMSTDELYEWIKGKLVEENNGCKLWNGANLKGYGLITINGVTTKLHRFVLEQKLQRKIAENMCALHSCNNPSCCNSDHITEGSNKENVEYKVKCQRQSRGESHSVLMKGEKNANAKLTENDVREIRDATGKILQSELAKKYNVSRTHISAVQLKRLWGHVV
jgi:hypothetical protein